MLPIQRILGVPRRLLSNLFFMHALYDIEIAWHSFQLCEPLHLFFLLVVYDWSGSVPIFFPYFLLQFLLVTQVDFLKHLISAVVTFCCYLVVSVHGWHLQHNCLQFGYFQHKTMPLGLAFSLTCNLLPQSPIKFSYVKNMQTMLIQYSHCLIHGGENYI